MPAMRISVELAIEAVVFPVRGRTSTQPQDGATTEGAMGLTALDTSSSASSAASLAYVPAAKHVRQP
eukprot:2679201-Pyramimonas_sp.AAC.1